MEPQIKKYSMFVCLVIELSDLQKKKNVEWCLCHNVWSLETLCPTDDAYNLWSITLSGTDIYIIQQLSDSWSKVNQ